MSTWCDSGMPLTYNKISVPFSAHTKNIYTPDVGAFSIAPPLADATYVCNLLYGLSRMVAV